VVTVTEDHRDILIYPVGPGQSNRIPMPSYGLRRAGLFPDGKRLWFTDSEAGYGQRGYITDLNGAKPRALTPEGQVGSLSPDGAYFLSTTPAGKGLLYPTAGGEPHGVPIAAGEQVASWSRDGQEIFVSNRNGLPAKVYRLSWKTGRRELMREIAPADRAVHSIVNMETTPDGRTYAYSCVQYLSELYMVEGLKPWGRPCASKIRDLCPDSAFGPRLFVRSPLPGTRLRGPLPASAARARSNEAGAITLHKGSFLRHGLSWKV
jgi:hypothetical protein